jgi:hypothetical protein
MGSIPKTASGGGPSRCEGACPVGPWRSGSETSPSPRRPARSRCSMHKAGPCAGGARLAPPSSHWRRARATCSPARSRGSSCAGTRRAGPGARGCAWNRERPGRTRSSPPMPWVTAYGWYSKMRSSNTRFRSSPCAAAWRREPRSPRRSSARSWPRCWSARSASSSRSQLPLGTRALRPGGTLGSLSPRRRRSRPVGRRAHLRRGAETAATRSSRRLHRAIASRAAPRPGEAAARGAGARRTRWVGMGRL